VEAVGKPERQTAKAFNFGLIFGQGAAGLVNYARANYGVILSLDEAERFRNGSIITPGLKHGTSAPGCAPHLLWKVAPS
jgi:hypothetical protein